MGSAQRLLYELETGLFALVWFAFAVVTATFSESREPSRLYKAATWVFFIMIGMMFMSPALYPG